LVEQVAGGDRTRWRSCGTTALTLHKMNFLDPREPRFRGLLFFRESRKSNSFFRGPLEIRLGKEFTDSALKNLDKKGMERYSVSQVTKRIQIAAQGIGRGFSTKGGSEEELNQTGCNQSLVLTRLAGARLAAQL
jgi:hypothetical protein